MANIGKKKGWVVCPVATREEGSLTPCIVAVHSTTWDGQELLCESDLQADGRVVVDLKHSTRYFNFCPDCGRPLRKPDSPKPVGPPNERVSKSGRVRKKGEIE